MIDIIFLTNGDLPLLRKAIESIKTEMRYELIVVDSATNKDVEDYVRDKGGKYLPTAGNFCFGRNVNIGVKFGGNPLKLVCNDDITFDKDAIDTMVATMEMNRCGMVGPRAPHQPYPDDGNAAVETKATLNFFCVLINEGVFKDIGYMDKQFTGYGCDDDDFCIRAIRHGHRLMIAPATVYHKPTSTYKKLDKETMLLGNQVRFLKKWHMQPAEGKQWA